MKEFLRKIIMETKRASLKMRNPIKAALGLGGDYILVLSLICLLGLRVKLAVEIAITSTLLLVIISGAFKL